MKQTKYLLACPVFKEEIELCLSSESGIVIEYLDDSIHTNPSRMKNVLEEEILRKKKLSDNISLLIGSECHCDVPIKQIAENCNMKMPLEKNCTEIILGPERTKLFQKDRTSVITNGWVNMRKRLISMGLWSEVDEHIASGHFDRLLLLEYGTKPLEDEEILGLYDFFQVPIETAKVDLNHFKSVLKNFLNDSSPERFQTGALQGQFRLSKNSISKANSNKTAAKPILNCKPERSQNCFIEANKAVYGVPFQCKVCGVSKIQMACPNEKCDSF